MSVTFKETRYGKRLRWARNVVKNWEAGYRGEKPDDPIERQRYERACALILADKLRQ